MDEKEILQRQIDALEKLLNIKESIIQEQEKKISELERRQDFPGIWAPPYQPLPTMPPYAPPQPPIFIPSVFKHDPCSDGGPHEYDFPWYSTNPQPCKKCGKTTPGLTITSSNDVKLGDV